MNETASTATAQPPRDVIDHSALVSDVNRQYPKCRPVFEKYGIAGCGGEYGPPEPIFIFAAAHRVPLREFVAELNQAVRGEWKGIEDKGQKSEDRDRSSAVSGERSDGEHLYKWFVWAALAVALTAGFGLGIVNLTRISLAQSYYSISGVLKQVHGHTQLFGWIGLFIMGVALHAVPRMKMRPLISVRAATIALGLMLLGLVARTFGQPFASTEWGRYLVLGSGLLELAAIGTFVGLLAATALRSEQEREPYEKFIWASLGWFLVLAVWNLLIIMRMFSHRSIGVPMLQNAWWIQAALFGFVANMIFGFSLRVLPHFLGLRHSKIGAANIAFVMWNAAIFLRYPIEQLAWPATALEAMAAALFVYALGIFARRRTQIEIKGVDNAFAWFLYLGFGWLLVTALLPFHADIFRLSASTRHAMALGFITPVIFGVAQRVLPIFNGVNLWSNRLMRATFWHLAAGTTLALAMAFNVAYGSTWTYIWAGCAGYAVFGAFLMFAVNIAMTLRERHESFTTAAVVTAQTRVAELLEVMPWLRPVLIHNGLGGLAAMKHNPPRFVTIEFAARRHSIDPQPLILALNEAIQKGKPQ